MKKYILVMLGLLIFLSGTMTAEARIEKTPAVNNAIRMYKAKDYTSCYALLQNTIKQDPSNALAYYYLAMASAQIGKKDEAVDNYNKVISLAPNGQLAKYATKGRVCIEEPERCHEDEQAPVSEEESFIRGFFGSGFSDRVRSDYEKQKIENLMREINRKDDVEPQKFRNYKDYSSAVPTNDEIVYAIKVLQKAGIGDLVSNNMMSDFSIISGERNLNNDILMNLMGGNNSASLNSQMIQSLLTNQLSIGF